MICNWDKLGEWYLSQINYSVKLLQSAAGSFICLIPIFLFFTERDMDLQDETPQKGYTNTNVIYSIYL